MDRNRGLYFRVTVIALAAIASVGTLRVIGASGRVGGVVAPRSCADAAPLALFQLDLGTRARSQRLFADAGARGWAPLPPSPDGRWFAFAADNGLNLVRADRRQMRVPTDKRVTALSWSPDGKEIAFRSSEAALETLWVVRVDGTGLRQLADQAVLDPSWSPDSRSLAFVTRWKRELKLIVTRSDGSHRLAVAPASGDVEWSQRREWIAYSGRRSLNLHAIRRDGSGDHVVGFGHSPSWAPDGRHLIFNRTYHDPVPARAKALGIANLRGRLVRSFETGEAGPAVWSPRGDRIVFPRQVAGGRMQLFSIKPDGTGRHQLTHDRAAAQDDPIAQIVWVTSGPNRGRRLFYFRTLCHDTP